MKGLSQLTEKIREWNFMGLSLLQSLEVAIIHSTQYNSEVIEILLAFKCHDLLYNEVIDIDQGKSQDFKKKQKLQQDQTKQINRKQQKMQEKQKQDKVVQNEQKIISKKNLITLQSFDPKLKNSLYGIYLTHKPIDCRIHLVIDKENDEKISDQTLKRTKKIIQKLKRNKSMIFVNFNSSTHKLDEMTEHIEQFGLSFKTKQRQIRADQLLNYGCEKSKNLKKQKLLIGKKDDQNIVKTNEQLSKKQQKEQKLISEFNNLVKTKMNTKFNLTTINFTELLMSKIQKKYISLFAVEINKNFLEMKMYHKQVSTQIKRYNQLFEIYEAINKVQDEQITKDTENNLVKKPNILKEHILTKYALISLHKSKQYIITSLMGTFTNIEIIQSKSSKSKRLSPSSLQRSLHWQVMQIMNEIWDIQGDTLLKQIDKMPLTYIKQRYKMLDYQTIGGFMPGTCFQAIFSAPLRKMVEHIMETLEIIEMKIVTQVKCSIEYFFNHTSCCFDFSDSLAEQIAKISRQFRKQTQKVLKSQIEYISVSSEDFWSFKQVKSNLYGPQQQIYIEIKYIGKNYIKKVFDSIRQTLPRLIGQNLLKELVNFLQTNSLTLLTNILRENPLQIQLSRYELQKIKSKKEQQTQIDELIYYFSLKTSSQVNVKNLNERMDKGWKRMFGKNQLKSFTEEDGQKDLKKQGFFAWAKQLFTKSKKQQRPKRSLSQQKKQISTKIHVDEGIENPQSIQINKKNFTLSEKNWLLIVNTDKVVQTQKIYQSSCQGFPSRLRPSIWLYLARKQYPINSLPKVQTLLTQAEINTSQQESLEIKDIYKQIDKDVNRTPPPSLFRKGYLKDSLTRVLRAYSIYDKSLRYTQGMNFVVAIILCVLTHHGQEQGFEHQNSRGSKMYFEVLENNCFTIFVHMMQKKGLRKIMLIERQTMTQLCIKLTSFIEQRSLVMSEKIQQSGFTIEMIFSPALISALTSADIEFPLQKRVIDFVLVSDFHFLYKVIGGFVVASENLCEKIQGEMLYYFLKGKLYNEVYKVIGDDGMSKLFKGL